MGITAEFIVGCIGVLTAEATTMELPTTKGAASSALTSNCEQSRRRHSDEDKGWGSRECLSTAYPAIRSRMA